MKGWDVSLIELREYESRKVYHSTESGARTRLGSVTLREATIRCLFLYIYFSESDDRLGNIKLAKKNLLIEDMS